ncbi:hypothetical protein TREMEDRAFT_18130, partial [Tremella mesenterica DSM 1558]|uniref:uncharacterized protein n=1 Tax=Tremella mesenterica (strain ATCC 24925 / CBS 8224 / DSM 1558 / NBRC 9311 / NRRL Y-6157 / RJB 2259-6 / UBC 559-6) TaxID=578456 RepID=UPI0003F493FF
QIADLAKEDTGGITLTPNESNILSWRATLPGPPGSPYEGGIFEVDIRIPDDYPFSPPHLHFLTQVYHCNIAPSGAICLDLLKTNWSPALSLYKVILSLSSLLTDPNPSDPLVPQIAQQYKRDRKKHDQTAREYVKMYALPKPSAPVKPTTEAVASSSRPKPIHRPESGSAPSTTIAGTRRARTHGVGAGDDTIDITSDGEDDSDVEVLGEGS